MSSRAMASLTIRWVWLSVALHLTMMADGPQVAVRVLHAHKVRAHVVLDAVLLEERLDAVADLRVVVLREREERKGRGKERK